MHGARLAWGMWLWAVRAGVWILACNSLGHIGKFCCLSGLGFLSCEVQMTKPLS